MRYALISDIHGNLPALETVLDDIRRQHIDKRHTFCLGDVIGYGPFPKECLDLARRECYTIVAGNHECAAAYPQQVMAFMSVNHFENQLWTRGQLTREDILFLQSLPTKVKTRLFVAAHGKPCITNGNAFECVTDYTIINDCETTPEMIDALAHLEKENERLRSVYVAAFGHVHQGRLWQRPEFCNATIDRHTCPASEGLVLCSVPSTGLPRDNDWRTGWVEVDEDAVRLYRLTYDVRKTIQAYYDRKVPLSSSHQMPSTK